VRVAVITIGTEGDLRPFLSLGQELVALGHQVEIVSHQVFEPVVLTAGLEFSHLDGDPREALASALGQDVLEHNDRGPLDLMKTCMQLGAPYVEQWLKVCHQAALCADVLVVNHLSLPLGVALSEALDMPLARGFFFPTTRTGDYPAPGVPSWLPLGRAGNRLSYPMREQALWLVLRSLTNELRRDVLGRGPLGLRNPMQEIDRHRWPVLYSFSEQLCPRPSDWPDHVQITGYWFNEQIPDWQPPAALEDFIAAGPPPVSVGFGSMMEPDPTRLDALVGGALRHSGHRAVVISGWQGLASDQVSDRIFVTNAVPHHWLFPQMKAVVHHGGAGTTGAGMRAGVPNVVVPFLPDQRFWARRIACVGAGPAALPDSHISSDQLAAAIDRATEDSAITATATNIGRQVRSEHGAARAAHLLDRAFAR
jgi:sterol 3beta-glucosyltransferase